MIFADTLTFGLSVDLGPVECDQLNEASGIAMSRQYTNVLWSHNDSGDESRIYAMSIKGKHLAIFQLQEVEAIDWEDIACGPGPDASLSYIYIADMGDNRAKRKIKSVYRVPEPSLPQLPQKSILPIKTFDRIQFNYPDGIRDAETLMLDPSSRDIYIVSKREQQVKVYRLAYPQSVETINTAEIVATLPFSWAVGGDISPDGNEMLIKTDSSVYYWKKSDTAPITAFFSTPDLVSVPYTQELQGEAICWYHKSLGYFTVSEEPWRIENNEAHVMFYPRLTLMDINQDRRFDIADITYCLEYIADLRPLPKMPVLPDINHNNRVYIEELIYGLQMLIQGVQANQ
ncbi:MAG: hypothetical protein HQK75_05835 [Candidatus Magnetomorum sp.]|nr:hypothetical protein [Candidatus Magnetomorum sp.]